MQKEAQAIILKAENEAKQILTTAKEHADQNYQMIISQVKGKAENEQKRSVSLTEVEIRNSLLQTKEELVDAAFEKAMTKLEQFTSTKEYNDYLLTLIEQAAKQINSKNLLVQVNAKDKTLLKKTALNALSKKLNCNLTFSDKNEEFIGGCKIETEDAKITYDNTIDNRIREIKPALRVEVAKKLFEEEA